LERKNAKKKRGKNIRKGKGRRKEIRGVETKEWEICFKSSSGIDALALATTQHCANTVASNLNSKISFSTHYNQHNTLVIWTTVAKLKQLLIQLRISVTVIQITRLKVYAN